MPDNKCVRTLQERTSCVALIRSCLFLRTRIEFGLNVAELMLLMSVVYMALILCVKIPKIQKQRT